MTRAQVRSRTSGRRARRGQRSTGHRRVLGCRSGCTTSSCRRWRRLGPGVLAPCSRLGSGRVAGCARGCGRWRTLGNVRACDRSVCHSPDTARPCVLWRRTGRGARSSRPRALTTAIRAPSPFFCALLSDPNLGLFCRGREMPRSAGCDGDSGLASSACPPRLAGLPPADAEPCDPVSNSVSATV
jgi:hypothetical protein